MQKLNMLIKKTSMPFFNSKNHMPCLSFLECKDKSLKASQDSTVHKMKQHDI